MSIYWVTSNYVLHIIMTRSLTGQRNTNYAKCGSRILLLVRKPKKDAVMVAAAAYTVQQIT